MLFKLQTQQNMVLVPQYIADQEDNKSLTRLDQALDLLMVLSNLIIHILRVELERVVMVDNVDYKD